MKTWKASEEPALKARRGSDQMRKIMQNFYEMKIGECVCEKLSCTKSEREKI